MRVTKASISAHSTSTLQPELPLACTRSSASRSRSGFAHICHGVSPRPHLTGSSTRNSTLPHNASLFTTCCQGVCQWAVGGASAAPDRSRTPAQLVQPDVLNSAIVLLLSGRAPNCLADGSVCDTRPRGNAPRSPVGRPLRERPKG
jgi:hypothetical protein